MKLPKPKQELSVVPQVKANTWVINEIFPFFNYIFKYVKMLKWSEVISHNINHAKMITQYAKFAFVFWYMCKE